MPKTKFFRVAVEGDTVDGRKIERSWLTDIAATFDPKTYGARVNLEHIRGISGTAPFKSYGDVVGVRTAEVDLNIGGKVEKRLALEAELDVTEEAVAMNRDKQKIYTSIEVQPNFANSGKAYLVGLAMTDSPASLGTEVLSFALDKGKGMSLAPRVQQDGNIFSLGLETRFELAEAAADPVSSEAQGFFSAATAFFKQFSNPEPEKKPEPKPAEPANDNDARLSSLVQGIEKMTAGVEQLARDFGAKIGSLETRLADVTASIEKTDARPDQQRPIGAGFTAGQQLADF